MCPADAAQEAGIKFAGSQSLRWQLALEGPHRAGQCTDFTCGGKWGQSKPEGQAPARTGWNRKLGGPARGISGGQEVNSVMWSPPKPAGPRPRASSPQELKLRSRSVAWATSWNCMETS